MVQLCALKFYSPVLSFVLLALKVHVPSPPLDLVAIPLSPKSLLIKWRPPVTSDGPILHYKLFYMEVCVCATNNVIMYEIILRD